MNYKNAFLGSLIADAVAMPVHWYYNTSLLDRDYPNFKTYLAPKNPHSDSILFRSTYVPLNEKGEILGEQAKYWGQRDVHYHQFLQAGENTLNLKLACELYHFVIAQGQYEPEAWAKRYVERMHTPEWHGDTYLEEYHRSFFESYARGRKVTKCAAESIYIGGLSQISALLAALDAIGVKDLAEKLRIVDSHIALTHSGEHIVRASRVLVKLLHALEEGLDLKLAIREQANDYASTWTFESWEKKADREVIGRILTPACYLPESMTASIFLAWKYEGAFEKAVIANALVGGDSCHRGVVLGSLLAACGDVPEHLLEGLLYNPFEA